MHKTVILDKQIRYSRSKAIKIVRTRFFFRNGHIKAFLYIGMKITLFLFLSIQIFCLSVFFRLPHDFIYSEQITTECVCCERRVKLNAELQTLGVVCE